MFFFKKKTIMVTRLLSLDFQPEGRVGVLRGRSARKRYLFHGLSISLVEVCKRGSLKGLIVYNYPPVEGEVNDGAGIPRREASRYTPRAVHRP